VATPAGQFRPWRHIVAFLAITAGLYALVFFTPGSNTPKLGIDLQGGTRITLTARTADGSVPPRASMLLARDIMERRVNGSGVAGAEVQIDGTSQLVITVPGTQDLTNLTRSAQLNLRPVVTSQAMTTTTATGAGGTQTSGTGTSGTDTSGTATSAASASASAAPVSDSATATSPAADATTAASQGLRNGDVAVRTDPTTTGDTSTVAATSPAADAAADSTAAGTGDTAASTDTAGTGIDATTAPTTVAFPSTSDPNNPTQPASSEAADWTTWQNDITVAMQSGLTCAQLLPYQGLDDPAKPLVSCDEDGTAMYVLDPAIIEGDQIDTANSQLSQTEGWVVMLRFKSEGFTTWAAYTTANVGKSVAFVLDGQVVVAPTIQGAITTDTQITGNFAQSEAVGLANSLNFGALPLAFERSSSESVTAELGLAYLQAALIAGGIGLLLVTIYCLIYYRLLGLITVLSLVLSFGLIYAVMVLLGRWINLSLDMAGVAGLIIAIGITADSFVVYFERIKDEVREGRTFRSAVPRGWARAQRTILSADAVSFLGAAILYILAIGEVKGFAFTLGLSTVLDLVVVFLVTHPLVALASGAKVFTSPTWSGLGSVAAAGARQRAEIGTLTAKG